MNPVLGLIIANIIWGAASPIFKYSMTNIPIFTLLFIRLFFAAFLFLPFVNFKLLKTLKVVDWLKITAGAIFAFTIHLGAFFMGLQRTESIYAPVIASAAPIFLFFIAVFFLHEKIRYKVLGGILVSLLGLLIIILAPSFFGSNVIKLGAIEGNIFYVIATLSGVIATIILKDVLKKISFIEVCFLTFFISGLTFVPLMLPELQTWHFSQLNIAGWTGILFGIFLSSGAAYALHYFGLSRISTEEIGIFAYVDPIAAVLIAAPLLHEFPNFYFFAGSLLVFGGIYLSEGRVHYHPFHRLRFKK